MHDAIKKSTLSLSATISSTARWAGGWQVISTPTRSSAGGESRLIGAPNYSQLDERFFGRGDPIKKYSTIVLVRFAIERIRERIHDFITAALQCLTA
jgi:hypothetical protein